MVSNSLRSNAFGRQISSASSLAAVSSVSHSSRASSCWVFSRVATARSLVRFTPWSSPCWAFTSRIRGSSSSASSAITSATVVPVTAVWAISASPSVHSDAREPASEETAVSRLGIGPGVLDAAVQAQGLLLHDRGDRAVPGAQIVAVPQGMPDLVVDHVEAVGGDVAGVVRDGGLPPGEVDDGALAVAAGGVAPGAHAGAVLLHVPGAHQGDA